MLEFIYHLAIGALAAIIGVFLAERANIHGIANRLLIALVILMALHITLFIFGLSWVLE